MPLSQVGISDLKRDKVNFRDREGGHAKKAKHSHDSKHEEPVNTWGN